jgi:dTMP kinase
MPATGSFIVFEGIDGSGTTTQAERLRQWMHVEHAAGRLSPSCLTMEPTNGPIGVLLRKTLQGMKLDPDDEKPWCPSARGMALLFTADRLDHALNFINPRLNMGEHVVCDRYLHSTLAYQSLTANEPQDKALEWLMVVSRGVPLPDLTIVLDVPPEEAAKRRALRAQAPELYEEDGLQVKLAEFYRTMPQRGVPGHIEVVDGARSPDEVAKICRRLAKQYVLPWSVELDDYVDY